MNVLTVKKTNLAYQLTHFALMCCGPTVVIPWETEFEKPGNAGPGCQSSLQTLDEISPVDGSETQKGSGAQLASYLGLDIINNVNVLTVQWAVSTYA